MAYRPPLAVLTAALAACTVQPIDLIGKSCSQENECGGEYRCNLTTMQCALLDAADAGTGADAGQSNGSEPKPDAGPKADAGINSDAGQTADAGGCGAKCTGDSACKAGKCVSVSGCSDGTREAFVNRAGIAGCNALWNMSNMRYTATGVACGNSIGDCPVPADACGAGWHVCATPPWGPGDVVTKINVDECNDEPGRYATAVGDQECEPCSSTGYGAACCGAGCVQQNGSCLYPNKTKWFGVFNGHTNACGEIESHWATEGVLCCIDP